MRNKRLTKSNDKVLLGVCGGIAEFIGWPRQTVRISWLVLTLFGLGIFVYPILALIMPAADKGGIDFDIDNYSGE